MGIFVGSSPLAAAQEQLILVPELWTGSPLVPAPLCGANELAAS